MRRMRILALFMACALAGLFAAPAAFAQGPQDMPYRIEVDVSSQIVTVYENQTGEIARQMLCSTGRADQTPTGDYVMQADREKDRQPWYWISDYRRYVRYATRIRGELLFHSLPYTQKSLSSPEAQALKDFGFPASHGCVRLRWQDARFIAENCLPGTAVRILKSGERRESLREMLLGESYDADRGFSYEGFMGIASEPGALGRDSTGQEVLDLQYRLRDLGIYDGDMTGTYDSATIVAVREAQFLMGEAVDGVATAAFREKLFADDAPTAANVALTEGMSGPAVDRLRENLAALRLCDAGEGSGTYDAGVVEAVRTFECAYGYAADGVAEGEVQRAVDCEAERVRETFGGGEYTCEQASDTLGMARVTAEAGVALREKPSQKGKKVKSLRKGALAIVLEPGKGWSRVRSGDATGYVKNDYVRLFEQELTLLRYSSTSDDRTYTVGCAAADYRAGASLPSEAFSQSPAASEPSFDLSGLVNYVTVDTRGEAASLNLRQSPDADGAVLATVPDGVSLRARRQYAEWTRVIYEGQDGYLLNRYLRSWTGPEGALQAGEKPDAAAVDHAVVETVAALGACVYDGGTDDALLLGRLPSGAQLEVLDVSDGRCLIQYQGRQGYMDAKDLRLVLRDAAGGQADAPESNGP